MATRSSPQQSKPHTPHPSRTSSRGSDLSGAHTHATAWRQHTFVLATCLLVAISYTAWAFGHVIIDAGKKWTTSSSSSTVQAGQEPISRALRDVPSILSEMSAVEEGPVAKVVNYDGVEEVCRLSLMLDGPSRRLKNHPVP